MFFFKCYAENKAERLVPDLFFFFKEAFCVVKASALELSFNLFKIDFNLAYNKNKLYKTRDRYRSRDMFNF